jgi:hypothetical protein
VTVEKYGCPHTCPPISRNNQAIIGESIPCSSAIEAMVEIYGGDGGRFWDQQTL